MKKLAIVVAMTALGLGGCAGNDYKLYAETQQKIAEQKAEVEKYKAGKTQVIGFFVGLVMKETRGRANPGTVNKLLRDLLTD